MALVAMLEQNCTLVAGNRAIAAAMAGSQNSWKIIDRYEPVISRLLGRQVERARRENLVHPEISTGDIFIVITMVQSAAMATRTVDPENWRRYLALLLNGLRHKKGTRFPLRPSARSIEDIRRALGGAGGTVGGNAR